MTISIFVFLTTAALVSSLKLGRFTLGANTILRLLIPSWRFYEEVGEVPALFYRVGNPGKKLGPWKKCLSRPNRGLILNPDENLHLACKGLVGQLVCESAEWDGTSAQEILNSVPYRLVLEMVKQKATETQGNIQFKISRVSPSMAPQDFLISGTHEI